MPVGQREAELRSDVTTPPLTRTRALADRMHTTIDCDARNFIDGLPNPPMSFVFTEWQRYDQLHFFSQPRHSLVLPPIELNVDLYDATVVAVLPDDCSDLLRQLILSLLITHADCRLNKTGRLTNEIIGRPPPPVRSQWCANLVRRSLDF